MARRARDGRREARHTPTERPDDPGCDRSLRAGLPTLTAWVKDGWIEIGRVEGRDSFVAALDEGGLVWEGRPSYPSLDDALAAMERGVARWLARNG